MKTKQLIFAMCCMAALASCSNEEPLAEVTPQAKQVTLTLTYGDGADTRTAFTATDAGLSRVWAAGDKVYLHEYNNSSNVFGTLELSSGAGTKTATFSGTLAGLTDGDTKTIYVKYGPIDDTKMDWSKQKGTLKDLGDYDICFYKVVATLSGDKLTISSSDVMDQSLFIHLPKNLKLLSDGDGSATLAMHSDQFASEHDLSSSSWEKEPITAPVTLTGGKLASDVYLAAYQGYNGSDISFTLTLGGKSYKVTLPKSSSGGNGQLFTVPQSAIDTAGGFVEVS